jgi:hypothetical protein
MEFYTKIDDTGNTTYHIVDKNGEEKVDTEVSEKAYYTAYESKFEKIKNMPIKPQQPIKPQENECSSKQPCPRCSMIRDMAKEIRKCKNLDEAFETLRDFLNFCEQEAYHSGFTDCIDNQMEILGQIREAGDNDFDCEDE